MPELEFTKQEEKEEARSFKDTVPKVLKDKATSVKIKIKTKDGVQITEITKHTMDRSEERKLTRKQIEDALRNPLHISEETVDDLERVSKKYIGAEATCVINPSIGKIATVWKTGKSARKKYEGKD